VIYLSITPPPPFSTLSSEDSSWFPQKPAANNLGNKSYLLDSWNLQISACALITVRHVHFFIFILCTSYLPFLQALLRRLHNAKLRDLHCTPNITRDNKSRRMRWAGRAARMRNPKGTYWSLVGRPERKEATWKT
jgi:hypothetical protein